MLMQAVLQPSLLFFPRHPCLLGAGASGVVAFSQQRQWRRQRRQNNYRNKNNKVRCAAVTNQSLSSLLGRPTFVDESRPPATAKSVPTVTVKAVVTVLLTIGGVFEQMEPTRGHDNINDLFGPALQLELVSDDLDERGSEKTAGPAFVKNATIGIGSITYEASFSVPESFGKIGAVVVQNELRNEMFLKGIVLTIDGNDSAPLLFDCKSWLHSKFDNRQNRIFFTSNKSYLPSETPEGMVRLRHPELKILRGDGTGERKKFERIYDYDVYNDLGDPDRNPELARPVLGGSQEFPYPRRCRTGRPRTRSDPKSEQRSTTVYVPRDESFSEVKQETFSLKTLLSALHGLLPSLEVGKDPRVSFPYFTAIDKLFNEGLTLLSQYSTLILSTIVPRLVKGIVGDAQYILKFELPELINRRNIHINSCIYFFKNIPLIFTYLL